jgi:hypothetical protein
MNEYFSNMIGGIAPGQSTSQFALNNYALNKLALNQVYYKNFATPVEKREHSLVNQLVNHEAGMNPLRNLMLQNAAVHNPMVQYQRTS